MCGRYALEQSGLLDEFSETWTSRPIINLNVIQSTWNAAPTQLLPVLVEDEDEEQWGISAKSWGLIPRWTKPGEQPKVAPINARSETVGEKPMFRSLVKGNRCIVPASGFYEWERRDGGKQPWFIHRSNGQLMLFAGLYDDARNADGSPRPSYTILTTRSNDAMAGLHDRMPVIIPPDEVEHWLSRSESDFAALDYLLHPLKSDEIALHEVSKAVNSPANNTPDLIEPQEETSQPSLLPDEEE